DGQTVKKGDILAIMESPALKKQQNETDGQLAGAAARIHEMNIALRNRDLPAAERANLLSQLAQEEPQLIAYQETKALLDERAELLNVRSPIDGQVISSEVKRQLLNRPVNRQQILMEVADPTSEWEMELYMPETRMGHVQQSLDAQAAGGEKPKV